MSQTQQFIKYKLEKKIQNYINLKVNNNLNVDIRKKWNGS